MHRQQAHSRGKQQSAHIQLRCGPRQLRALTANSWTLTGGEEERAEPLEQRGGRTRRAVHARRKVGELELLAEAAVSRRQRPQVAVLAPVLRVHLDNLQTTRLCSILSAKQAYASCAACTSARTDLCSDLLSDGELSESHGVLEQQVSKRLHLDLLDVQLLEQRDCAADRACVPRKHRRSRPAGMAGWTSLSGRSGLTDERVAADAQQQQLELEVVLGVRGQRVLERARSVQQRLPALRS